MKTTYQGEGGNNLFYSLAIMKGREGWYILGKGGPQGDRFGGENGITGGQKKGVKLWAASKFMKKRGITRSKPITHVCRTLGKIKREEGEKVKDKELDVKQKYLLRIRDRFWGKKIGQADNCMYGTTAGRRD